MQARLSLWFASSGASRYSIGTNGNSFGETYL